MSAVPAGWPRKLSDVDVFDPATYENWYRTYDLLRSEAPIYNPPGTNMFFLTSYADIQEVLRRTDVFKRGGGASSPLLKNPEARAVYKSGYPKVLPLAVDPPRHRRFRDMIDHFFSVIGSEVQRPLITRLTNELIDEWIDDGEVAFLSRFARPLPARVICSMMGFPLSDLDQLAKWSDAWVSPYSGQLTPDEEVEVAKETVDFQFYIKGHIDRRRSSPGDDIISHPVHTPVNDLDGERLLTDGEIINIVDHLFIGGNETTTFALTSGMWLLISNPEVEQAMRADPGKVRAFVEEVLRLESPTQGMTRHIVEDTAIGTTPIPAGSVIHLRYAAANRDADQFPDGACMDLERENAHRHLAFSIGESHCPGAGLTRLEQNIVWTTVLDRLDNLAFAEDRNDFSHAVNFTLRSFDELHITFGPRV